MFAPSLHTASFAPSLYLFTPSAPVFSATGTLSPIATAERQVALGGALARGGGGRIRRHRQTEVRVGQAGRRAPHIIHSILDAFFHVKQRTANVDVNLEADGSAFFRTCL